MNKKFETIYRLGADNKKQFRQLAEYIVDNYYYATDGIATAETIETWKDCLSMDFGIGAELVKRKNLLTGFGIGVGLTILGIYVTMEIRKRLKMKEA